MSDLRYAPEAQVLINDAPIPAALRASISGVSYQTGLEGADRVDVTLVNENLRWIDHPLLAMDNMLTLALGYAPGPLERMFVGDIVSQAATFPGSGAPTLTISAQDRRARLQKGNKLRWFAVPVSSYGNLPIPDVAVASMVTAENGLIPITDPIVAAISVLLGGAETALALGDPNTMQKLIRKQHGESDFDFLGRIARENGWEMLIDHSGPLGGHQLRFMSLGEHLAPDLTLRYGRSLIDFSPRITSVGQVASVTVTIWLPDVKMEFKVTVSWDWDRHSLDLSITPGYGLPGGAMQTPEALEASISQSNVPGAAERGREQRAAAEQKLSEQATDREFILVDEPATKATAPRIILGKLLPRLNRRLTGTGRTVGDTRIRAGAVVQLEGLGQKFGGLYRITSATHTLDGSGYQTSFEVRKEIWFASSAGQLVNI